MGKTRFELDGHVENPDGDEFIEPEVPKRGPGLYILLALFIILFLTSLSLFVYFQFYLGQGKWDFSFEKHNIQQNSSQLLLEENNQRLQNLVDSIELLKVDTSAGFQPGDPLFSEDGSGEVYEVQIGFFKSFDFDRYDSQLVNMNVEYSNGASKLLIGRFQNFEDACAFRREIIDIGIKGAFVVKKVNGVREDFDAICP
ncbi:MAG: hypothetical protein ISR55_03245 [Bacteroidetes bacterium]|nr:hypothetical protein [Bacteroidota bacterium]MBL6962811.1 hypothetical protein [Bacteroidota bacterium]